MHTITISCDECVMQHTPACDDCVVSFLCDREPDADVVMDTAEAHALTLFSSAGMVPVLRHRPAV